MSTWIDILTLGAEGDSQGARELLYGQVRVELLLSPGDSRGAYRGLLPKAVASFINRLPEDERALARLHQDELVDYVMDDVITGMEKPLLLVELCRARPLSTLDDLVELYPWEEGLKRSSEWKRKWIADMLKSLRAAKVALPPAIISRLGDDEDKDGYEFNEVKYALKSQRLEWSWDDFKRKQNLNEQTLTLFDPDAEDEGVAEEMISFGGVTMAEVVLRSQPEYGYETTLTLVFIGQELSEQLTSLLEDLHEGKAGDGYKPIAWHNVSWYVCSEYVRLRLKLDMREPYHEEDEKLASHIACHYPEVAGTSRSTIRRRRRALQAAFEEQIRNQLKEKLSTKG